MNQEPMPVVTEVTIRELFDRLADLMIRNGALERERDEWMRRYHEAEEGRISALQRLSESEARGD